MIRPLLSLVVGILLFPLLRAELIGATPDAGLASTLNFEREQTGSIPAGWHGGPPGTLFIDSKVVHGGKSAVRIERTSSSPRTFSTLTKSLPMDFKGRRVELRGFLRTEQVRGFASLWMREDGEAGTLEFGNMQDLHLTGTNEWKEYSVSLPLNSDGRTLAFGVLLAGIGKAWADDLQLLVDGKPIWEAPKAERILTILDRDKEFLAGSRIDLLTATPVQIANLATLCKVWGFLKYHHQKVTSGQLQWDFELFRVMPAVFAATDRISANKVLLEWVNRLGKVTPGAPVKSSGSEIYLRPDLSWTEDKALLGEELSERLREVHTAQLGNGSQFYVSLAPGGNPVFIHELSYPRIKFPDSGYQLLGLFRFWNIIRYWSPYRDLIGENWDEVLSEFIPRVAQARSADAYQLEMMALIAKVHDTHANLWSSLRIRPPVGDRGCPSGR